MAFTSCRNTCLADMYPWSPAMRLTYRSQPLGDQAVQVELPPLPQAYRKGAAFANVLSLVRLQGSQEQKALLEAMVVKFLAEDGGL